MHGHHPDSTLPRLSGEPCEVQVGVPCLHCRLLRLKLTDSKLSCIAAEFKAVPQLSEDLPPGTKVCCTNVSVKLGVLLLDAKSIQVSHTLQFFLHKQR